MHPDQIIRSLESPKGEPNASSIARCSVYRMYWQIGHARSVCRLLLEEISTPGPDGRSQLEERHGERVLAQSILSCLSDAP